MLVVLILLGSSHKRELMVKERPELFFMTRTTCSCYAPFRSLHCSCAYSSASRLDRCKMYMPPNLRTVVVIRSIPLRPFAKTLIADRREGDRERESSEQVELICQLLQTYNFQTCPGSKAFFFHFFHFLLVYYQCNILIPITVREKQQIVQL